MESMRNSRIWALSVVIFLFLGGAVQGVTITVGPGGPGGGYDYATIQEGINAAVNGDKVIVADGTYTGADNKNLDFGGKAITVRSTDPEDPDVVAATIIDCENSGRGFYFHSGEDNNSVVAGLTIKRGRIDGTEEQPSASGGGIYCSGSSPTIANCRILNNSARGYRTVFEAPSGNAYGGGIYCTSNSHPVIINCEISGNSVWSTEEAVGCDWPWGVSITGYGGGIFCSSDSTVTVYDSTITANRACGGMAWSCASWQHGAGDSYGGGIYIGGGAGASIENCVIADNRTVLIVGEDNDGFNYGDSEGAGIYCGGNITVNNCTISGNNTDPDNVLENGGRGSGIYGPATVSDCIIWGNISGSQLSGATSVSYSDVAGGWSGTGNINADPLFVTGPSGDYYLSQTSAGQGSTSPCVDAGNNAAAFLGMGYSTTRTDHVNEEGVVDMGYHYLNLGHNNPDINADWYVNCIDYAIFASQWLDEPGVPSADIAPYIRDGIVDTNDLAVLADFWLECYVSAASSPSPGDNESSVYPNDVLLSWSAGGRAAYHDVYFGTNANLVADANYQSEEFMGTVSDANFSLGSLELGTYYYWRIDEAGLGSCNAKGNVWSFRTMGVWEFMASNPHPYNAEYHVDPYTTLSWTAGYEALSHDVYLGTNVIDVDNATVASDEYMGNFDVTSYDPCGLDFGAIYFWRIDEENVVHGIVKGAVWSFTTMEMSDFKAINPDPADGAMGVDPNTVLSWTAVMGALSHDVYLGTGFDDVNDATPDSNEYMGNFDVNSYDPCGLDPTTTYYWRVDEKNVFGTAKGDVWSFTTWNLNPVGWWEFEEGTGGIAYDSSGNGNDGTLSGLPAWVAGKVGDYALDFDGVADYVDIPYDSSLDIDASDGITASVWIKLSSYPDTTQGPIFGLYDSDESGTKNYLLISKSTYGNIITWDQCPPSYGFLTSIKPDLNVWYHIVAVQNSTYRAIYINGTLDSSDNSPESYSGATPDTIRIGNRADGLAIYYFNGTIDDVRIYDRVLSAGEIWALYQAGL